MTLYRRFYEKYQKSTKYFTVNRPSELLKKGFCTEDAIQVFLDPLRSFEGIRRADNIQKSIRVFYEPRTFFWYFTHEGPFTCSL